MSYKLYHYNTVGPTGRLQSPNIYNSRTNLLFAVSKWNTSYALNDLIT